MHYQFSINSSNYYAIFYIYNNLFHTHANDDYELCTY